MTSLPTTMDPTPLRNAYRTLLEAAATAADAGSVVRRPGRTNEVLCPMRDGPPPAIVEQPPTARVRRHPTAR
jgi:hypothetical protein